MTSPANTAAQIESIVRDLKTNSTFADLSPEDLTWLAERMEDTRSSPEVRRFPRSSAGTFVVWWWVRRGAGWEAGSGG